MVKIQLETGYLDVRENSIVPFNLGVADVRDLTARSGTFSKTITLSGTKNNNILLGHYYDVNISTGSFNVNTLTKCDVLQDDIPILTDVYLQLLSVNKRQTTDAYEQEVEYEVLIKDSQADFFTKIDNSLLEDLDMSEMDHVYSASNVVASYSNTVTDGYVYPLGTAPSNVYPLSEFKPAIYAKKYWDKIHQYAGYTYEWSSISDDFFDKLVIPYNGEQYKADYSNYLVDADFIDQITFTQSTGQSTSAVSADLTNWGENQDNENVFDSIPGEYNVPFNVSSGQSIDFAFNVDYQFNLINSTGSTVYLVDMNSSAFTGRYRYKVAFTLYKNGTQIIGSFTTIDYIDGFTRNEGSLANGTTTIGSGVNQFVLPSSNLVTGDVITIRARVDVVEEFTTLRWKDANSTGATDVLVDYQVDTIALNIRAIPSSNILSSGADVVMNTFIPRQVKQKDFVKSICQMYNLFVEPDESNPFKLIYKTRDDFYDSGVEKDWTLKLAKDRQQSLQFLPELSAKKLQLTYKQDKDEPNVVYEDAVREIYGQAEFIYDNEYVKGIDKKELIFSPTPVNVNSFGAYVPMIAFGAPKTNIRILIHNGTATCGAYNVYDYGTTGQTNVTTYPVVGHFDNPLNPTFDINFATCDYYYYSGINLTNNNLYNNYWRRTVGQINTGKMLTAYFDLRENDIRTLKLNDKIRIDNSWWHINKVIDYDANSTNLTKVELMSVDQEIDLPTFVRKPFVEEVPTQGRRPIESVINAWYGRNNVNLSYGSVVTKGLGNVVIEGLTGVVEGNYKTMVQNGIISESIVPSSPIRTEASNYNVLDTDSVVILNKIGTKIVLPLASESKGKIVTLKNTATGNVRLEAQSPELVEGSSVFNLSAGEAATAISDGVNWWVISNY